MKSYGAMLIDATAKQRSERAGKIQFLRRNGLPNSTVRAMVGNRCYALPFHRMNVDAIVKQARSVRQESRDSRVCASACVRTGMAEYFRQLSLSERETSSELILIARFKSGQPLNSRLRRAVASAESGK